MCLCLRRMWVDFPSEVRLYKQLHHRNSLNTKLLVHL